MELNWIAPVLVAIGGIITTIVALRRATEDHSAGAFERFQKFADEQNKGLERQSKRIRELEVSREEDLKKIQTLEEQEYLTTRKLDDMTREHKQLTDRVNRLAARVDYYRHGVALLIKQLLDLGVEPAWKPNDEDDSEPL